LHVESVNRVTDDCTINLIAITQTLMSGCWVLRKRLNHLLSGPLSSLVFGHVEVDNFTPFMAEHEKYRQDSKCRRRHSEEVD
jgi:hypothetical protein